MARLVKIIGISHVTFSRIRGAILAHAPWALRNDIYDGDTSTAYLFFEDSDYIPLYLHPFILTPPFDKSAMEKELKPIAKELGWIE